MCSRMSVSNELSGIKWSVNTKNCISLCWCLLFQCYLLRVSLLRRLLLQSGDGDAGSGCGSGWQSGGFGFHLWPAGALLVGAQAVVADVVRHLVQLLSQLLLLQVHLLPLRERRGAGGSRRSLVGFRGTEERICGWEKRSVCLCLSEGRRCDGASGCFQERETDESVLAALDRSSKLFLQSLSRRSFTVAHAFLTDKQFLALASFPPKVTGASCSLNKLKASFCFLCFHQGVKTNIGLANYSADI